MIFNQPIGEHELKYVLPNCRAHNVRSWLLKSCQPDPQYQEGCVSSIYFDTKQFDFLDEKINSTYLKTKVRLRWYSVTKDGYNFPSVFLEVKKKIGSARVKKRILVNFDSNDIIHRNLEDSFFQQINSLLTENGFVFRKRLFPVFQIDYKRSRFVDPHTTARLCIDRDISASRVNRAMVNNVHHTNLNKAVFEYKDPHGILPDWYSPMVAIGEARRGAFSKYSECYAQLLQTHF